MAKGMIGSFALRGTIVSFREDPFQMASQAALDPIEDGLVVIDNGKIAAVGDYAVLAPTLDASVEVTHHEDALICPGFVDTHAVPKLRTVSSAHLGLLGPSTRI